MRVKLVTYFITALLFVLFAATVSSVSKDNDWSPAVNGLQVRLSLGEAKNHRGTRRIVPYLELRNIRDLVNQMEVNCDRHHLKVELVNKNGEPIQRETPPASGLSSELNTIVLPMNSSMTISLEAQSWMTPKAAAVVVTRNDAWLLSDADNGNLFLRATLSDEPIKPYSWKRWYGTIQTPLLRVTWK